MILRLNPRRNYRGTNDPNTCRAYTDIYHAIKDGDESSLFAALQQHTEIGVNMPVIEQMTDEDGHNITLKAITEEFAEAIYMLHAAGANLNVLMSNITDDGEHEYYNTGFCYAVASGHHETIKALLECGGADILPPRLPPAGKLDHHLETPRKDWYIENVMEIDQEDLSQDSKDLIMAVLRLKEADESVEHPKALAGRSSNPSLSRPLSNAPARFGQYPPRTNNGTKSRLDIRPLPGRTHIDPNSRTR